MLGNDERIGRAADWIGERRMLRVDQPLPAAAEMFRSCPALRMLVVVDADNRPVGAIYDSDMRALLYSPYGYSLLCNPSFGATLESMMRPVALVEADATPSAVLAAFADAPQGCEGLVVVRDGRVLGAIGQPTLLRLVAESDAAEARRRSARADRIDAASRCFQADARNLARQLTEASDQVATVSGRMAVRAEDIGRGIAEVASASDQAAQAMRLVADRGDQLAGALATVEARTGDTHGATCAAVRLAADGAEEVESLRLAAGAIEAAVNEIEEIARHTGTLSLNASIEAARAGAAGVGFAVVAGEVKALAAKTRAAARTIHDRVAQIGTAVGGVYDVQSGLGAAVGTVETLSGAVEDALRAQTVASRDISVTVHEVGTATRAIGDHAIHIQGGTRAARDDAALMRDLADTLVVRARSLEDQLGQLVDALRAA